MNKSTPVEKMNLLDRFIEHFQCNEKMKGYVNDEGVFVWDVFLERNEMKRWIASGQTLDSLYAAVRFAR